MSDETSLSDNMIAALRQVARDGTYKGFVPACQALERRGLLEWQDGRPLHHGFVITDRGHAALREGRNG